MHGKGKFTWKDGKVFEGQFEFLCPVEGTFTESDGSIFQVKYDKNTRIEPNPQLVHSRMKPRQRILALDPRLPPNERNYHLLEADSRSALTRIEDELAGFLRQQKIITDIENATRATTDPCVLPPDVLAEWTQDFSPARRIGSGSFGDVFEAHCPRVGRLAVKRLNPDVRLHGTAEDQHAALMCARREVNVLGAFRHPNIIRLLGYTEVRDRVAALTGLSLCLVYELAARGGLDGNLRSPELAADLTWQVRVRVAAGVARALNYLHCHDPRGPAFHRDVKSANVTLTAELVPKLIDCGLARYRHGGERAGTVVSAAADRVGTPGYRCPAYERSGDFEARSEVFSFGMVLLELLTGRVQGGGGADLYGAYVEEEGDLAAAADARAGAWEGGCRG